tara:strand:- start:320 stop:1555 length:1236 start_codon:yes stop_codon:yes gene_type:complete
MQLSKPQQAIANDKSRWRIVVAGRRFGKTYLAIREMCYFARIPKKTVYYIAPTYRMCKAIVWEELKERLHALRWVKRINETELSVVLVNGSKIVLAGADSPDRLRGIFVSGIVIFDEYADMDQDVWTVMRPALADKGGHAMWIGTPKGKSNHFYDMYQWAQDQKGWSTYKYTTIEGGNVPAEEIRSAEREMDERTFKQEFMADWVDYKGLVYYAFTEQHIEKIKDDANINVVHIGMDFNIDPGSATIATQDKDGLHVFDEIELRNSNTFEMVDEITRRYPNSRVIVYPDPAGSARKTSSNTTDHRILQNAGFTVQARRAHPRVKDRINSVNSAFASGKIKIDPKCKSLRSCLNKLSYREGSNEQDKTSGIDHMPDALGYMVEYLYPITKIQTTRVEPTRWAMNAPPLKRFG